jgi:predicted nucleotidyltransferase component of viral defense system
MTFLKDMKAATLKFSLVDSYLGLLSNLSSDNKLELISKLSDSLKSSKKPTEKSVNDLYGAFIFDKSSEEMITVLKKSRNFNRKIEGL